MDAKNSFLNGFLNEIVVVSQLPGLKHAQFPTQVCQLRRVLYGLKQAPRAWYDQFSAFLFQHGFKSSTIDPPLFVLVDNADTILLLYVDDILISDNSSTHLEMFLDQLKHEFPMTNLGQYHYFLGVKVDTLDSSLFLS